MGIFEAGGLVHLVFIFAVVLLNSLVKDLLYTQQNFYSFSHYAALQCCRQLSDYNVTV